MPTHANKMIARWCGPYTVVKEYPDNNYVRNIRGREALFHMNALRCYETDGDEDHSVDSTNATEGTRTFPVSIVITGAR